MGLHGTNGTIVGQMFWEEKLKYSEFCQKIYPHIKRRLINTQAWFVQAMFVSGGSNYFPVKPNPTDSYEKKLYQGSRPITTNIADSFSIINIDELRSFFKKNINDNDLEQLLVKFSFADDIEKDFDYFCEALAHQFAEFIKNAPNDSNDIIQYTYQEQIDNSFKAVRISKTLTKGENFDNIFLSVNHTENPSTTNECQLNLYHLNATNSRFSFDALESFLLKNIIRYVHDRMTIDKYTESNDADLLMAKALGVFKKATDIDETWLDNELGNMLIYMFLEQVLEAPKIYSKIELLNIGNKTEALSGGSIHLLTHDSGSLPFHQLIFGKSNINNDIKTAIDSAFDSVQSVLHNINNELNLIENPILSTCSPRVIATQLANILVPKNSIDRQADNSFGIFLGYSIKLPNVANAEFKNALTVKMQEDIKNHSQYITEKIKDLGLSNYSFYFYFLPFNDADTEKKSIIQNILRGGN